MQNETVKIELEVSNITGTQIDQYVQQGVGKTPELVAAFLLLLGFSNLSA